MCATNAIHTSLVKHKRLVQAAATEEKLGVLL